MEIKTVNFEFIHTKRGLWLSKDGKKNHKICEQISLPYVGCTMTTNEFFMCIQFKDQLGTKRTIWMPFGKLYQPGFLIRELRNLGMEIDLHTREKAFLEFIQAVKPKSSVEIAERVGWVNDNSFLRGRHLVSSKQRTIVLAPDVAADISHIRANGSLKKWNGNVGSLCLHSKLLVAAVAAGFAAPLFKLIGVDGGGFHFYGSTSIGKTTCLYVAASVIGDPEIFVETWKTTETAAEQTASKHHCHLLCMDELMQIAPNKSDAGKIASSLTYLFGNGVPKRRDKSYEVATGGRAQPFNVSVLSSGELSFDQAALQSGSPRLGGEEMRMVDIRADQGAGLGIFDSLPEGMKDPARLSKRIKKNARDTFGMPFKVYMNRLLEMPSATKRQKAIELLVEEFIRAANSKQHLVFQHRFAERFAVLFAGGALAIKFGVLDWDRQMLLDSILSLYETACMERRSTQEDTVKKVVKSVQRKLRNATDLVDFSDEKKLDVSEADFKDHGGLRMLSKDGEVMSYKVRGKLLNRWCGSKQMKEPVIDYFDERNLLEPRKKPYQGRHARRVRCVGKTTNRYRYFTFKPGAAERNKKSKKRK